SDTGGTPFAGICTSSAATCRRLPTRTRRPRACPPESPSATIWSVRPAAYARSSLTRLKGMDATPTLTRGFELPMEPRLPRIGAVDAVALEARAADLAKRSIKRESKLAALDLIVRMTDLTTLEGADTPGKVAALCQKAVRPDP